jgi:membrane protein implicated in regulation of membrane protease activity
MIINATSHLLLYSLPGYGILSERFLITILMEVFMKGLSSFLLFSLLALTLVTHTMAVPAAEKQPPPPAAPASETAGFQGTVIETINSAGYTYVNVDTGKDKIWAAAPETPVKKGDKVTIPPGMLMRNHHSKTLNRTFDAVYFVSNIAVSGMKPPEGKSASDNMDMVHGRNIASTPADITFSGITKPEGGKTVNEIYLQRDRLSGKDVILRGKVVKFSRQIMGKNWMHVQDGTGDKGANDLTITTAVSAKVGDTVLIKGVLTTNKDFGVGYKYDVIIEDAQVTVE